MGWDTEKTKTKILVAATNEFVARGPNGTTIERIASEAGVNKERIYNYFGGKDALFRTVLHQEMTTAFAAAPVPNAGPEAIAEYAGQLFDYMHEHPQFVRLLQWEALTVTGPVVDEEARADGYAARTAEIAAAQGAGRITGAIDADLLNILLLGIAGYWAVLPQVTRMVTRADANNDAETARRRAAVVEAAYRLASPTG